MTTGGELTLIDLDQPRPGYRQFLSCWAWQGEGLSFLVDPGPASTIEHLAGRLSSLGFSRVDYVLLTHVHLDHGGGTAEILERFPEARWYCHASGVDHLVDPRRLWQGSVAVLGEVAAMYGEPRPADRARQAGEDELSERGISVIATPGHAPHHVSFLHDGTLYAGEAIGTRLPLADGRPYLRLATPPRFYLEQALASLDRLMALEPEPERVAVAHYGESAGCRDWCRRARAQLTLWVDAVRELRAESSADLESRLFDRLMKTDPLFGMGCFEQLDADLQQRERHFLRNTLDGILSHLEPRRGPVEGAREARG